MATKKQARPNAEAAGQSRIPWPWIALGAIGLMVSLTVALWLASPSEGLQVGDPAPAFSLPSTDGTEVALIDYLHKKNVLLFFSMTNGCAPCMLQIHDLQDDSTLPSLDVALVSIGIDSLPDLISAGREFEITSPLLSDRDSQVSKAYGVLEWAMRNGEPGHTFILVDKQGVVRWIQDYGAPQNGGLMYVSLDVLLPEIERTLSQ